MTGRSGSSRRGRRIAVTAGVVLLLLGGLLWDQVARPKVLTDFADPAENFLYGGLHAATGIPYELFVVLPDVFPELVPGDGGYEAFGLLVEEDGHPIGFARQKVGFEGVTPNCALCHTATYRTAPDAEPVLVPGAPSRANLMELNRFLWAAVEHPDFEPSTLLPVMEERFDLSFADRLRYRVLLVRLAKFGLTGQRRKFAWSDDRPPAGWGRMDAFSVIKYNILGLPDDGTIGVTDNQALWRMDALPGLVHWAGVSDSLRQVEYMSLFGMNLDMRAAREETFERVRAYLGTLEPPPFPFPVDSALAIEGAAVFRDSCAGCHVDGAGERIPVSEVGTDPAFLASWSGSFVERLRQFDKEPFVFTALQTADGYVSKRLDGIWMRAPYLHNGSVPTLRHLLELPEARPETFGTGNDLYDPEWMGFEWRTPRPGTRIPVEFDTRVPGNSNAGHAYGTTLSDDAKRALLEYLKTL